MTTPVKLKLIPRSTIKAKNITRLVGQVEAGVGASVTLTNGNWVVALDGTAFQPLDADLTGLSALSGTGVVARTAGNTYTTRTIMGTTGEITVANGAGVAGNPTLSLSSAVWTDYTPTITATTGTFTAVSAAGTWKQLAKLVLWRLLITVTTVGSASGRVTVPIPTGVIAGTAGFAAVCSGWNSVTRKAVVGTVVGSSTSIDVVLYDGTFPVTTGEFLVLQGWYEAN